MISIVENREIFASRLSGLGLEFGALTAPTKVNAAVEYADHMTLEQLRAKYPGLEGIVEPQYVLEGDSLNEIPDGRYDFVMSFQVIEHIPNPIGAIRKWTNKLKDWGSLIIGWPEPSECPDSTRRITPFAHLLDDDRNNVTSACDEHKLSFVWAWNPSFFPRPDLVEKALRNMWDKDVWTLSEEHWAMLGDNKGVVENLIQRDDEIHHHMFQVDTILQSAQAASAALSPIDVNFGWGQLNERIIQWVKLPQDTPNEVQNICTAIFNAQRNSQTWAQKEIADLNNFIQNQRRILDERYDLINDLLRRAK
jgi:SAM-dependent methyltransferase